MLKRMENGNGNGNGKWKQKMKISKMLAKWKTLANSREFHGKIEWSKS